jgi:hypothetical protein
MGKLEFDFREGLDKDHIVYRKKGFDCKHCIYYLGYLLFTWGYTVAFFALFQYVYTNHEPVAFPIYVSLWLAFLIFFFINAVRVLRNYQDVKKIKKANKEAEARKLQGQHGIDYQPTNENHPRGIEMAVKTEKDNLVS